MIARKRREDFAKIQMTPMIDMTFLLLVFFMVTSKITKEQKKMEIGLPVAAAARVPDDFNGRDIVNIDGRGAYYIGDRPATKAELKAYLRQRFIDYPPLKLAVRADAETPGRQIKEMMQLAADAGAIEVIFATHKK